MKCPRCSAEIPADSRFCLRCGTPMQPTGPSYTPPNPVFQPTATKRNGSSPAKWAVLGLIGLGLIGVLAWGFSSRLLQHPAHAAQSAPLVQAPAATTTAPLVQAPAVATPSRMVQAPAQPGPQVNVGAISNYLAFLRKVELMKQDLIGKEMGAALGTYGNLTPNEIKAASSSAEAQQFLPHISQDSARLKTEWDQLIQYFLSVQPPPECATLQQKYYEHLAKIEAEFVKVNDSLADAQSNPQEALNTLSQMLGTASADADASAVAADQALADVCNRYGLTKDFSITTGSNASSLLH
ncbi:zinc-ribbon domain [Chthonomonas calidirosea]|uniref:zinc ribbon domain-containing protein n=1 Tax=Chthonomonas calidirosea TaxID=454171 RepID=UPI0006DD3C70|nr:zinc ribbon domain-containing protein [Chthonomonas calidirosea]CEK12624.1 zinc-ribbon domain [Chthonomonas calidirosea]CEK12625.1 zinc-ribbon domain [Chthonomonas calidirosea]